MIRRARLAMASGLVTLLLLGADAPPQEADPPDDDAPSSRPEQATTDATGSSVDGSYLGSEDEPIFGPAHDVYDEGGFAYVFGGWNWIDLSALNDVLRPRGFGRISPSFLHIGTGALVTVKRWLFGFETYRLLGNTSDTDDNQATFDGSYWIGHIAYLFSLGPLHLYPILGLGWGTYELALIQGRPTVEEVLDLGSNGLTIQINAPLLQAAVGLEYLLATSRGEDSVRGFLIGLRIGYFGAPFGSSWSVAGYGLDDPSGSHFSSFHLSLVAGFGSWRSSDHAFLP